MVLSSQHNHNTEGFYLSTLKKRHKPSIIKGLRAFFKISLFLYIIKIRKNPSRPLFSRVHRVFFHALPLAFFITRKKPFPFCVGTCALQTSQRRARRGKNTPPGPTLVSLLEGLSNAKRLRFFLRHKIGSLLYLKITECPFIHLAKKQV